MNYIKERVGKGPDKGRDFYFAIESGLIVMKKSETDKGKVVVPESLRAYVLKMHHNIQLAGHQGKRRTIAQIEQTFYWPGLRGDVIRWVRACLACRRRKTPRPMRAGIRNAKMATYPNETVAMDIVGPMLQSIEGNVWILTMIDHFTRWPVAIPIPERTSAIIAKAIFKYWVCEKGVPEMIVSDRGRELISKGMKQMCLNLGIARVSTGGYNPTGNASVERFHRYLGASLCIVYEKKLPDWDEYLPAVLFSYRVSINDTTGHSPFRMETGRDPNLPMRTMFPHLRLAATDEESYVYETMRTMDFAIDRARRLQYEATERNRLRRPDNQYKPMFEPGDYLLVWEKAAAESRLQQLVRGLMGDEGGRLPQKLQNPWTGPYKMIRWHGERACVIDEGTAKKRL
jgi:transposase InsO family protein